MSIHVLEEITGLEPSVGVCASVPCSVDYSNLVLGYSAPHGRFCICVYVADGVSECSATLDDSVSEEEEGSFDELTDGTPYLQPGVEISVLNEVRLRRGSSLCHVANLARKRLLRPCEFKS